MKLLKFPEDASDKDKQMFVAWGTVDSALKRFENEARPSTFEFLFGEEDGKVLWGGFVTVCGRDLWKFKTHLKLDWWNTLVINATLNEELYIK